MVYWFRCDVFSVYQMQNLTLEEVRNFVCSLLSFDPMKIPKIEHCFTALFRTGHLFSGKHSDLGDRFLSIFLLDLYVLGSWSEE